MGWINVAAGWLVPYLLGIAWALGSLRGRRVPALMLAGGAAATAALITWAGYPASMVGVNGAHISNLNPPTLAAVSFGIAQCGPALLLRDRLARLTRRPLAWAGIALVNLSAMTLFLWHQTAFITVSSAGWKLHPDPGNLRNQKQELQDRCIMALCLGNCPNDDSGHGHLISSILCI